MFGRSKKKKEVKSGFSQAANDTDYPFETKRYNGAYSAVDLGAILRDIAGDNVKIMSDVAVKDDANDTYHGTLTFLSAQPLIDHISEQPTGYSIYQHSDDQGSRAIVINWRDGVTKDKVEAIFKAWEEAVEQAGFTPVNLEGNKTAPNAPAPR